MKTKQIAWVLGGMVVGVAVGWWLFGQAPRAMAGNDRHEEFAMCTGAASVGLVGTDLDGVWLLDYRAGKLLGTVVNRTNGRVNGWAEVDLVKEFGIPPRTDAHFMMTTGQITRGQAALYVAETTTGKFGVYTMVPSDVNGTATGLQIRRHDMTSFRAAGPAQPPAAAQAAGGNQ